MQPECDTFLEGLIGSGARGLESGLPPQPLLPLRPLSFASRCHLALSPLPSPTSPSIARLFSASPHSRFLLPSSLAVALTDARRLASAHLSVRTPVIAFSASSYSRLILLSIFELFSATCTACCILHCRSDLVNRPTGTRTSLHRARSHPRSINLRLPLALA